MATSDLSVRRINAEVHNTHVCKRTMKFDLSTTVQKTKHVLKFGNERNMYTKEQHTHGQGNPNNVHVTLHKVLLCGSHSEIIHKLALNQNC